MLLWVTGKNGNCDTHTWRIYAKPCFAWDLVTNYPHLDSSHVASGDLGSVLSRDSRLSISVTVFSLLLNFNADLLVNMFHLFRLTLLYYIKLHLFFFSFIITISPPLHPPNKLPRISGIIFNNRKFGSFVSKVTCFYLSEQSITFLLLAVF